jgi:ribonuclease D
VPIQESYTLVNSQEGLNILLNELDLYDIAAVDTEADSMYHYSVRLCLIQITLGDHHWIIDPLSGIDVKPIFSTRAMQTIIFHGADYDLRMLWNTYKISPKHVFDTMLAAKLLGEERLGLAHLVEKYFDVKLIKDNQKADWTIRPLPLDMCEYAIHDTLYLHELCAILGDQLISQGKFTWLIETCDELIEHSKVPHELVLEPWRISGSSRFSPEELNLLKSLWEWREKEAATLDRPPYKVLGVELMFSLIHSLSGSYPNLDMDRLPKLPRNFNGDRLDSFKETLEKALQVPPSEWPLPLQRPKPPLNGPDGDLLDALHIWRDEKAEELKFDPSLLANRTQLIALATPGKDSWEPRYEAAHLMRWQRNIWNMILNEHLKCKEFTC